jgi:hypothetical protein
VKKLKCAHAEAVRKAEHQRPIACTAKLQRFKVTRKGSRCVLQWVAPAAHAFWVDADVAKWRRAVIPALWRLLFEPSVFK